MKNINNIKKIVKNNLFFIICYYNIFTFSKVAINTSINTLEAGGDQRHHRHNADAINLAIEGENVYSMIEDEKIYWKNGVAQITPASELHSHHNRGSKRMESFVVQDEGLHWYLRTTGFSWD